MMSRIKKSLTFSNAIAVVALFFALGGTVYAAAGKIDGSQITPKSVPGNRLKPGSVGAPQLKKGAIGAAQLKANSVGSAQIKSGAITGKQIKAGSIEGAQIKSGSLTATQINQTTLTGVSAANVHTVQYVNAVVPIVAEAEAGTTGTATCPAGMKVIGGGVTISDTIRSFVNYSGPTTDRNSWTANAFSSAKGVSMTITAICTPVAAPVG
jgi:hypothetical protein